jgi:hypothetical protein
MASFGSSVSRFGHNALTGFGGKWRPRDGIGQGGGHHRTLTPSEARQVRSRLRAAAYTHRGVDWAGLFRAKDADNSGEIGLVEFKRLLRTDAKVPVSQLSDVSVKCLFHTIDLDGSGEIDVEEFLAWVEQHAEEDDDDDDDDTRADGQWTQDGGGDENAGGRAGGPLTLITSSSSGYGKVSPRELSSPSQRRYDLEHGWIHNNDEHSEAELAQLRQRAASSPPSSKLLPTGGSPRLGAGRKQKQRQTQKKRSSSAAAAAETGQALPKTLEAALAALAAEREDSAEKDQVLGEFRATIRQLQCEAQADKLKLKTVQQAMVVLKREVAMLRRGRR